MTLAQEFIYLFKTEDIFFLKDSKFHMVITGQAPMDFDEELVKAIIGLEWGSYKIAGVERFMHMPPWRKNEPIGLALVRNF